MYASFRAICLGESELEPFENPEEAILDAYSKDEMDEFIKPRIIKNTSRIKDDDGIFCFNFRADRVRELTPDIVFLDISMPGRNGLDVLQELKSKFSNIFVAMISGHYNQRLFEVNHM